MTTTKTPASIGWQFRIELAAGARRPTWLKARKGRITGSKISDIMGHGYHDVHDRYLLERGELVDDPAPSLAMKRGTLMEPEILKTAAADPARPGAFEVLTTPSFVLHPTEDWIGCSPDFLATSSSPPFCDKWGSWPVKIYGEIKSRDSSQRAHYKGGGCKPADRLQVLLGCICTGADLGLLVVEMQSNVQYRIIERDPDLEAEMIAAASKFRRAVGNGNRGDLLELAESGEVRRAIVSERYAESRPDTIDTEDPDIESLVAYVSELRENRSEIMEIIAQTEALIGDFMGEAEHLSTPDYSAHFPASRPGRRSFSVNALKAALPHIDLEPYYKTSKPKGRGTLRIRRKDDDEI